MLLRLVSHYGCSDRGTVLPGSLAEANFVLEIIAGFELL